MERELDTTIDEIIKSLVESDLAEELQPNEFSVEDYVEKYRTITGKPLSRTTATSRLNRRVENGELAFRMARRGTTKAYRIND